MVVCTDLGHCGTLWFFAALYLFFTVGLWWCFVVHANMLCGGVEAFYGTLGCSSMWWRLVELCGTFCGSLCLLWYL